MEGVFEKVHEWLEPTAVPPDINVVLGGRDHTSLAMGGLDMTSIKEQPQVFPKAGVKA